ncbi:hypothetical protein [Sphingomicrobium arenosum]|uniref:hypothetical protein n=1 Tax=Sphingomicrobium arenosum TaxID=2233861 RepID=UPI00224102FF|nr:hypothetical protein [Sphingomicrobium arenosum]
MHADQKQFDNGSQAAIADRRMQVRAYNYWYSLLDGRDFPSIDDLKPADLQNFAVNSVLMDFTNGAEDPALPYVGQAIRNQCDIGESIERLSQVPADSMLGLVAEHYERLMECRAPVGFESGSAEEVGDGPLYRGILMPFSSDDKTIDFVYAVINWKTAEQRKEEAEAKARAEEEAAGEMEDLDAPAPVPQGDGPQAEAPEEETASDAAGDDAAAAAGVGEILAAAEEALAETIAAAPEDDQIAAEVCADAAGDIEEEVVHAEEGTPVADEPMVLSDEVEPLTLDGPVADDAQDDDAIAKVAEDEAAPGMVAFDPVEPEEEERAADGADYAALAAVDLPDDMGDEGEHDEIGDESGYAELTGRYEKMERPDPLADMGLEDDVDDPFALGDDAPAEAQDLTEEAPLDHDNAVMSEEEEPLDLGDAEMLESDAEDEGPALSEDGVISFAPAMPEEEEASFAPRPAAEADDAAEATADEEVDSEVDVEEAAETNVVSDDDSAPEVEAEAWDDEDDDELLLSEEADLSEPVEDDPLDLAVEDELVDETDVDADASAPAEVEEAACDGEDTASEQVVPDEPVATDETLDEMTEQPAEIEAAFERVEAVEADPEFEDGVADVEAEPEPVAALDEVDEPDDAKAEDVAEAKAEDVAEADDEPSQLETWLEAAREAAALSNDADSRSRSALYRALGQAYDFSLVAEAEPDHYAALLEAAELTVQARAPMTPIVKLVFGVDYDKTRLTEFAAALSYGHREGLAQGEFEAFVSEAEGGLKGLVAAERALKRGEEVPAAGGPSRAVEAAARRLRQRDAIDLERLGANEEFALVLVRRDDSGAHRPIARVIDHKLVERAIVKASR